MNALDDKSYTSPLDIEIGQGAVRVGTLLIIRWVAIVGQAAALVTVNQGLHFNLPVIECGSVILASMLFNLYLAFTKSASDWLPERWAAWQLAFDVGQLSLLLYLTGGLENPFALMILAPVTMSATILSLTSTLLLSLLIASAITLLAFYHRPLPWAGEGLNLPVLYVFGAWTSMVSATGFIAAYVWRVAVDARRMAAALSATQIALAREQKLSALGALAAAAAHELGSPLSTITVVAKELSRDIPADSPYREDVLLLLSESARCREILAKLSEVPEDDGGSPLEWPLISALLEEVAESHASDLVEVSVVRVPRDQTAEPHLARRPEIMHGFGNLIQNAIQFAANRVTVTLAWSARSVRVTITDDGPGFPAAILARLGEPYMSSRTGDDGHMGLGVFIAATLLGRTGADVSFANHPDGGAEATVRWKRSAIDQLEPLRETKK
jgi:two-component system sensor histidine kinase RegB